MGYYTKIILFIAAIIFIAGVIKSFDFLGQTLYTPKIDPNSLPPEIELNENYNYYDLQGSTDDQLRGEVRSKVLRTSFVPRAVGSAGSNIRVVFEPEETSSGCTYKKLSIPLQVTITLPRWDPPEGTASETKEKWTKFLKVVEDHEKEHRDITLKHAVNLSKILKSLPPSATCEELAKKVKGKTQEVQKNHIKEQQKLDVFHGRISLP